MLDRIIRGLGIICLSVAVWMIIQEVQFAHWNYIKQLIQKTPIEIIIGMISLTSVNYLFLAGYDLLGLRYLNQPLPVRKILKIAFVSFGIGNTAGHTYAAGGAVRYWLYRPEGLTAQTVLLLIGFETLSIILGILAAYEIAVTIAPWTRALDHDPHSDFLYVLAIILFICFLLYFSLFVLPERIIKIKHWMFRIPDQKTTEWQLMIGLGDNLSLFLVFYLAISYHIPFPFVTGFTIFILAQCIGLITQVPGGLGVFEGTFLYLIPHTYDQKAGLLAGLIMFRVLYYFLPFIAAIGYLIIHWLKRRSS